VVGHVQDEVFAHDGEGNQADVRGGWAVQGRLTAHSMQQHEADHRQQQQQYNHIFVYFAAATEWQRHCFCCCSSSSSSSMWDGTLMTQYHSP
jgi:hypothetical protein